jgi:protease IV
MSIAGLLSGLFGAILRVLDATRKVLHFIFLAVIALVLLVMFAPRVPRIPSTAALVLAPEGDLVDQLDGDAGARAWNELVGEGQRQTLVRDLLAVLEAARDDTRIPVLVLKLDGLGGAGLSALQDLGRAIDAFRAAGKQVVAVGDSYSQNQYYLAAHADEIYLHPQGFVFLPGYAAYHTYYRSAIDKVLIDWNVFKVGEYKSFVEPYLRDDMSPEARENAHEWLTGLWDSYQHDVTTARKLDSDTLQRYAARMPALMKETGGDLAVLAREMGLVTEVWDHAQMEARIEELVGEDESSHSFNQVHYSDYLESMRHTIHEAKSDNVVGVIVAAGDILDGQQPPGTIGADSTAALVRQARFDEHVKAVVLRVDSGGGSAFASEVIGRELHALRESGKPLVTSMGSVAASGGYWISMAADEIWASPDTITGSIGIGAFFPTFQRTLDKLGIHVDGVGTTELAGDFRADRALGDEARQILQLGIENGYQRFISKVAEARELPVERVDEIARGRVWLGAKAQELGLVDKLGGLSDAIKSAAELAGVGDDFRVEYVEREPNFRQALAMQLATGARTLVARVAQAPHSPLMEAAQRLQRELTRLTRWNDPQGLYYACWCDVR